MTRRKGGKGHNFICFRYKSYYIHADVYILTNLAQGVPDTALAGVEEGRRLAVSQRYACACTEATAPSES